MLEIIKPPIDGSPCIDWHQVWRSSPEYTAVKEELARLNALPATHSVDTMAHGDKSQRQEFVASFTTQFWQVLIRTWKHFWRSPTYIWSKTILTVLSVRRPFSQLSQLLILYSLSILDLASVQIIRCKVFRISCTLSSCILFCLETSTSRSCPCLCLNGHSTRLVRGLQRSIGGTVSSRQPPA